MRLPEGNEELYLYDEVGNKTRVLDGRGNRTDYTYSAANKLLEVTDAKGQVTRYGYDRSGNQTRTVNALGQETINTYDELGRLRSTQDALGYSGYGYDAVGNLILSLDSRGTVSHYRYSANNLLLRVEQENQEQRQYLEYSYDEAGQRLWATDGKVSLSWAYDPLGNVLAETRDLATGDVYKMEYRYDGAGRLTKVRYPGDSSWLEYNYNPKGELISIPGYINLAPVYDEGGYLASYTTANGITTHHSRDGNGRLVEILSQVAGSLPVLQLNYTFDAAGNVTRRNNNYYAYDELNRLTYSKVEGRFRDRLTSKNGYVTEDYLGKLIPQFALSNDQAIALDYAAASLAADLGEEVAGISRLYLRNSSSSSRVHAGALDLYTADQSGEYRKVDPATWQLAQSGEESIFELREPLAGRFLKVHSKYDDRDEALNFVDQATFRNALGASLSIEQSLDHEEIGYEYDALGNRTRETVKLVGTKTREYRYYANSNRLLTDGQFAYVYDANGNLIRKGNSYELVGESVLFTRTIGEDVLYWEYSYDLANRLVAVKKNGVPVVSYTYDPLGLRIERVTDEQREHYVFNLSGDLVWKRDLEKNGEFSYIWWNGEHLAKVEGEPTDSLAVRFFYHTDLLGSPMAVTDASGELVWRQDYLPFGEKIEQDRVYAYAETHGLTGKEYDETTGLYYYNARWYDPELGRFLTEDPARDGLNWYLYALNNPLLWIDSSGLKPTLAEAADIAAHVYSGKTNYKLLGGWVIERYINEKTLQMGIYSRKKKDGSTEYVIANAGSKQLMDWIENIKQPFGRSEDVIRSIELAKNFVGKYSKYEITFVGHSKGGAEAATNAMATNKDAILFNSASFFPKMYGIMKENYEGSITNYIVQGEILNETIRYIAGEIGETFYLPMQYPVTSGMTTKERNINMIKNHSMDAVKKAIEEMISIYPFEP